MSQSSFPPPPDGRPQDGPPQYGQAPYGQPPHGGPQYGVPQYGGPPRRSRGPLVLVTVLGIVLVAVLAVGVVVLLRADDSDGAAASTPTAEAVQFRTVLKAEPGGCGASTSPSADGTVCGPDGIRYTLGEVELDGTHVSEVTKPILRDGAGWIVGLTLDEDGAQTFSRLTSELTTKTPPQNQLAIVVRGRVVTAPAVMSPILGGKLEISGNYTKKEAEQLVKDLTG